MRNGSKEYGEEEKFIFILGLVYKNVAHLLFPCC